MRYEVVYCIWERIGTMEELMQRMNWGHLGWSRTACSQGYWVGALPSCTMGVEGVGVGGWNGATAGAEHGEWGGEDASSEDDSYEFLNASNLARRAKRSALSWAISSLGIGWGP